MNQIKSTVELFFWPLVIGIISFVGLISALVADGFWDALSWVALTIPIAVSTFFSHRKS